jgi:hypothetical protein
VVSLLLLLLLLLFLLLLLYNLRLSLIAHILVLNLLLATAFLSTPLVQSKRVCVSLLWQVLFVFLDIPVCAGVTSVTNYNTASF